MGIGEGIALGLGGAAIAGLAKAAKENAQATNDINRTGHLNNSDLTPTTGQAKAYHKGGLVGKGGGTVEEGEYVIPKHEVDKHMSGKEETVHLSKHRAVMHLRKGGLHDALHIPQDHKIPADRLAAAKNSPNAHVAKMANLAATMKHWKH